MSISIDYIIKFFSSNFNLYINHPITEESWLKAFDLFRYNKVDKISKDGLYYSKQLNQYKNTKSFIQKPLKWGKLIQCVITVFFVYKLIY